MKFPKSTLTPSCIPTSYATASAGMSPSAHTLPIKLRAIADAGFPFVEIAFPDLEAYAKSVCSKGGEAQGEKGGREYREIGQDGEGDVEMLVQVARRVRGMCEEMGLTVLTVMPCASSFIRYGPWMTMKSDGRDTNRFSKFEGYDDDSIRMRNLNQAKTWFKVLHVRFAFRILRFPSYPSFVLYPFLLYSSLFRSHLSSPFLMLNLFIYLSLSLFHPLFHISLHSSFFVLVSGYIHFQSLFPLSACCISHLPFRIYASCCPYSIPSYIRTLHLLFLPISPGYILLPTLPRFLDSFLFFPSSLSLLPLLSFLIYPTYNQLALVSFHSSTPPHYSLPTFHPSHLLTPRTH